MPPKFQNNYDGDWKKTAEAIKEAAGWRCIRCNEGHAPHAGYCLTVHHFDGDKSNDHPGNLMALCQRCHLSVQARVDPETPLLMEPSDWARPYIAHFYESGRGVPGPTYDLREWIWKYELGTEKEWPRWAPMPKGSTPL